MNNFFTSIKRLITLKHFNIGIYKITKARSRFPLKLLEIRKLSTKKENQGTKAYIIAIKNIYYLIQQDLGTIQIITIVHFASDLNSSIFILKEKYCSIFTNLIIYQPNGDYLALLIYLLICKYNKHIQSFNANFQTQSYYLANIESFSYL